MNLLMDKISSTGLRVSKDVLPDSMAYQTKSLAGAKKRPYSGSTIEDMLISLF